MDEEGKRLLRETLAVEKENNLMLRKMRRDAVVGRIMTLVFWAITLGLPIVIYYYFLSPYVAQITATYQSMEQSAKQMEALKADLPDWARNLFDKAFSGTTTDAR